MSPINIDSPRNMQSLAKLTLKEKTELKRLSGQMIWLTSQTRPDMSFEICVMSNMGKKSYNENASRSK